MNWVSRRYGVFLPVLTLLFLIISHHLVPKDPHVHISDSSASMTICLGINPDRHAAVVLGAVLKNDDSQKVTIKSISPVGTMPVLGFYVINKKGDYQDGAIPQIGSDNFPPGKTRDVTIQSGFEGIIVVKVGNIRAGTRNEGYSISASAPKRSLTVVKGGYGVKSGCN